MHVGGAACAFGDKHSFHHQQRAAGALAHVPAWLTYDWRREGQDGWEDFGPYVLATVLASVPAPVLVLVSAPALLPVLVFVPVLVRDPARDHVVPYAVVPAVGRMHGEAGEFAPGEAGEPVAVYETGEPAAADETGELVAVDEIGEPADADEAGVAGLARVADANVAGLARAADANVAGLAHAAGPVPATPAPNPPDPAGELEKIRDGRAPNTPPPPPGGDPEAETDGAEAAPNIFPVLP
ncbi:hypothetical protein PAXINDRAFT_18378 [Paxillus involutus ATCC 200175]|uniref:Uncharacterized protein n=1 Tax=Paxillus involutus ATCC 200175 TaxID=664439 RepID=A0A0C9TMI6_PAXIN|nr:hypothetical protein PAXINDRAFT_18378 [Paxillus involutus ATCC 200175]